VSVRILIGDCREKLRELPDASVNCCVTSPPYFGLRDYGHPDQMGLEPTPDEFVAGMVDVFREVRRVLRDDGTLWLNIGDTIYSGNGQPKGRDEKSPARNFSRDFYRWQDRPGMGLPKKSLVGIPWKLAFALQADGWTLRSEIIWHRPAAFTQGGVSDRPFTTHETIFLLSKSRRYWFNEDTCAAGTVWRIGHEQNARGHSAAFPPELAKACIEAGCPAGGSVLDPFGGTGTTAFVADAMGRDATMIELNPGYARQAQTRIAGLFSDVAAA
jgi:DNA modification methylase